MKIDSGALDRRIDGDTCPPVCGGLPDFIFRQVNQSYAASAETARLHEVRGTNLRYLPIPSGVPRSEIHCFLAPSERTLSL